METGYQIEQGELVIQVPEELDHHVAEMIRIETGAMIEQRQVHTIIFDFQNTTFMDSSGIGVIIGRVKQMRQVGGSVMACNVNPQIYRIMALSGLLDIITIREESL